MIGLFWLICSAESMPKNLFSQSDTSSWLTLWSIIHKLYSFILCCQVPSSGVSLVKDQWTAEYIQFLECNEWLILVFNIWFAFNIIICYKCLWWITIRIDRYIQIRRSRTTIPFSIFYICANNLIIKYRHTGIYILNMSITNPEED